MSSLTVARADMASWSPAAVAAEDEVCSGCGRGLEGERGRLACRHHCCPACARQPDLYCVHCWTRPPAPPAPAAPGEEAELRAELRRLRARRREAVLRALDAATTLKARLEAELAAPDGGDWAAGAGEAARLRARLGEATLQARVDELVRTAAAPLDAAAVRRALAGAAGAGDAAQTDPVLLLANHCLAAVLVRALRSPPASPAAPPAALLPRYYFDLAVDGAAAGRVVVEVRADLAPRMARNFGVLAGGELGVGYRGCSVFQCWENESVITGDFELNNGRGGRSVFAESYFMPDDTRLAAVRGAVGMRRSQKRHDNLGLVGSQFRIVLREMRGFTAIFGSVVEGLGLVERVARAGDAAGKPTAAVTIAACGRLY